jgi:predicted DNA repair protein MutK
LVAFEREKIKGAVRTDFILSAEIIVIALGTVQNAAMTTQIAVVSGIALLMTVGVYALVAGIVKLDDVGLHLLDKEGCGALLRVRQATGRLLLRSAPVLMKTLAVVGTAAMFLVGGGILAHGLPFAHHLLEGVETAAQAVPGIGGLLAVLAPLVINVLVGIGAGALVLGVVVLGKKLVKPTGR